MKYKYSFFDDYSEGAHPQILDAFIKSNAKQDLGYGMDSFTLEATDLIRERISQPEADVYFLATGTQANLVGISWLLKSYESVIAAESGHICVYETGAIESTGHKVHAEIAKDGKLTPEIIQNVLDKHDMDQMVKPKAVYLSQSTEVGTVYNKNELATISLLCEKNKLYLYIDGARLGHALMIDNSDLDIKDIANFSDLFYIGGTKNGGLIGEAMVIIHPELKENFRFHLRQKGALLAKARAVSVQFVEFFKDDLYFDSAKHANQMAQKLARGIKEMGYAFLVEAPANQIFPIFPNAVIERLKIDYGFHAWSKIDSENSCIRLVTSWATPVEAVEEFIKDLDLVNTSYVEREH